MNIHRHWFRPAALAVIALLGLLTVAVHAENQDFDFGLPLFGLDEIRLEREKAPDFNLSLLKKFLAESENQPLVHLHAIYRWMVLIRLSDEPRAVALKKVALDHFKVTDFAKRGKLEVLDYIFLKGLLLAVDKEPDPKNEKDHEFEELLLKAEDVLAEMSEYSLVKGFLFPLLRNRPNGFFAPMHPLEDLKKALAHGPTGDPHFFFVMGQALRTLGNQENSLYLAISAYEKSSALVPANPKLQNTLLGLYMGLHENYQNLRKAEPFWLEEAVYKKILTLFPSNPHALNNLGFLYAEYGLNRELAQTLCQKAVDRMPENASFRDSLGWAAFKNQQYEKAETELTKSIAMNPEVYEPHYHLGTLYYVTKRYDKAISTYDKALQLKPEAPETLNNFAYLLAELDRDLEKAQTMAAKAVKLEPENASYIDTLAWTHFRMGKYEEAQRFLQKALQLSPEVGEILVHLGKVNMELGRFEDGLGFLKQAHRADPNLENLQTDLYLAIILKAQYGALEEYHRLYGQQVNPDRIKGILLTLVGIYQTEGLYSHAIRITQLCDKLKRGELDLGKPLFPFYQLETASGTRPLPPVKAPQDTPEVLPSPEGAPIAEPAGDEEEPEEGKAAGPELPQMAEVPFAIHFGPVLFDFCSRWLLPFPGFERMGVTLLVADIRAPSATALVHLEIPGLADRQPLGALSYYLQLLGSPAPLPQAGGKGVRGHLGRMPIWAVQKGDHLYLGCYDREPVLDYARLERTFPYEESALAGLYFDWAGWEPSLPRLLTPFIGNPFFPFRVVYSRYFWEKGGLREVSTLLPVEKVTQPFMKALARDLYAYKILLLRMGFQPEIKVKANETVVEMTAEYGAPPPVLEAWRARLAPLLFVIRPRLEETGCTLRRVFFGGPLEQLPQICPAGGTVTVNGPTGALECSAHRGPGLFPLLGMGRDRCAYGRERLNFMFSRLAPRLLKEVPKEELLNKFLSDYNIPPCPAQGKYSFDSEGRVVCSQHQDKTKLGPQGAVPGEDESDYQEKEKEK